MTTLTHRIERRDRLFDYLVDHPEGITYVQMKADLGLTEGPMQRTLRDLRIWCGDSDEINIVCDPQGSREPWLYRLVGNLEAARPWYTNQRKHLISRIKTSQSVAASLVAATDGRTYDGKVARKIARTLTRLLEDLAELAETENH